MSTPRIGRAYHEALILDFVRRKAPVGRSDLSLALGLNPAAVGTIVTRLIGQGLVRETGLLPSRGGARGGRRRVGVELVESTCYAGGLLFWRSGFVATLINPKGAIAGTLAENFDQPLARLSPGILRHRVIAAMGALGDQVPSHATLLGWGLGIPGWYPRDLDWASFAADLSGVTAASRIYMANNAVAAALGAWFAGEDLLEDDKRILFVYLGGGVGGSVVTRACAGDVPSFTSVELGHIGIDPNGPPCYCGSRGCLEQVVGSLIGHGAGDHADPLGRALGYGLRNLAVALDIPTVVVGGRSLGLVPAQAFDALATTMGRPLKPVRVRGSRATYDMQAVGAATLVFHRYLAAATGEAPGGLWPPSA